MKASPLSDRNKLAEAISQSNSIKEVLAYLGLRSAGGNYAMVRKWAEVHGLTVPTGTGQFQVTSAHLVKHLTNEEVFVVNSKATRKSVKSRLRKIWTTWTCSYCGLGELWNGKALSLQLDHINGVFNDNRLENLRLLCPNCHSQTDTYAGKRGSK
jgi:hypothetical protein